MDLGSENTRGDDACVIKDILLPGAKAVGAELSLITRESFLNLFEN